VLWRGEKRCFQGLFSRPYRFQDDSFLFVQSENEHLVFPKKVPQNTIGTSDNIDGFLLMKPDFADGNIPRLLYDVGDIDAERFEKGYKRGGGSHQPIGLRLEAFQV
jgi:hypothetical protein